MKKSKEISSLVLVFFAFLNIYSQDQIVPSDTSVIHKSLDNGFKYYIKHNTASKGNISVYLVVNAGFMHENDNQLEFSHLLEHVAMRGTKNFSEPPYAYLQQFGMKQGNDVNAGTGYLYTFYRLNVPAQNTKALTL